MKTLVLIVLTNLFSVSYAGGDQAIRDLSMKLGINHFNNDHNKPLISMSPKHKFMIEFINSIFKSFPQLKKISHYPSEERYITLMARLKSLSENGLDTELHMLTNGCPLDKQVTEHTSDRGWTRYKKEEINEYFFMDQFTSNNKKCSHMAIQELIRLGLSSLKIKKYSDSNNIQIHTVTLYSLYPQDLEFVLKELKTLNGLKLLSQFLIPAPLGRQHNYYEDLITLNESSGHATMSAPVKILFKKKWQRFGKPHQRNYLVKGIAKNSLPPFEFTINKIREWGDVLP